MNRSPQAIGLPTCDAGPRSHALSPALLLYCSPALAVFNIEDCLVLLVQSPEGRVGVLYLVDRVGESAEVGGFILIGMVSPDIARISPDFI